MDAEQWLRDTLLDGEWHSQEEVKHLAQAEGITMVALWRARKSLGAKSKRVFAWSWKLPPEPAEPLGRPPTAIGVAIGFLIRELAFGPVPSEELASRADAAGITRRTLGRAGRIPSVGVKRYKQGSMWWTRRET